MNEKFVAVAAKTRYPEYIGGQFMADGILQPEIPKPSTNRAGDGERVQKIGQGQESQKRIERIQKSLEEIHESSEDLLKPTGRKANRRGSSDFLQDASVLLTPKKEEVAIVQSNENLIKLSRDAVVELLQKSGVEKKVSQDWDSWKEEQREVFLHEQKIVNEVEPELEEREFDGKKYLVWKKDKDNYQVYGLHPDLKRREVRKLLKSLGKRSLLPLNWEKHDTVDRNDWLVDRGVKPLVEFREVEDYTVADYDLMGLTSKQTEKIFGVKLPENWANLGANERRKFFWEHKVIGAIRGAADQVPEWDAVNVNPNFDPRIGERPDNPRTLANEVQPLGEVITRRRYLINRNRVGTGPTADWTQLEARLAELVTDITAEEDDAMDYGSVRIQMEQMDDIYKAAAASSSIAEFDQAIPPTTRQQLINHMNMLNEAFELTYELNPDMPQGADRVSIFGDIDQLAADRLGSVKSGWITEDQAIDELLRKAQEGRGLEPSWAPGIRDWYVFEQVMPHVRDLLEEHRDLSSIVDPNEFEKAIVRGMRRAEFTNLSSTDLNSIYQRLLGLVTEYPTGSLEGTLTKNRLSAQIQASLLMNQIFIQVENGEAHPEKLMPYFEQIKNIHAAEGVNTFQIFLRRFRMRYSDGRAIEDDNKNPIYMNADRREAYDFNLLSDMINVIHSQLGDERLLLNEIQRVPNAQGVDRNFNAPLFAAAGVAVPPHPDNPVYRVPGGPLYRVDLENWFKHNTFMGASSEIYIDPATGQQTTNIDYRDNQVIAQIRNHLINARQMTPEQVANMEVMIRATFLDAVRFVQAFGWSEYDGIETDYENGKPTFTVFSPRTPFFARAIDNPFKHFRNENRGQIPRTNQVLEDEMPLGYMLPTVRVLARLSDNMFIDNPGASPPLNDVAGFNARWNLGLPAGTTIRQARDALVPILRDRFGYNFANAAGLAVADMIDHRNITFGRRAATPADAANMVNWEEELRDLRRFDFTDLFGDRLTALKMYDRGALQELLRHPTFDSLMKVYGELFYSGRNVRLWDNMEQALRAFHKMEQQAKRWFRDPRKGAAAETYENIEIAVQAGRMDPADEERTKRDLLGIWLLPERITIPFTNRTLLRIPDNIRPHIPGIGPVRFTRMYAEFVDGVTRDWFRYVPPSIFAAILQFFGEIFKQSGQQVGATR